MADLRENAETRKVTETLTITRSLEMGMRHAGWRAEPRRAMDTLSRWFARASRR